MNDTLAWGRQICGDLGAAEGREWLCTNGIGGFASGTVAGTARQLSPSEFSHRSPGGNRLAW